MFAVGSARPMILFVNPGCLSLFRFGDFLFSSCIKCAESLALYVVYELNPCHGTWETTEDTALLGIFSQLSGGLSLATSCRTISDLLATVYSAIKWVVGCGLTHRKLNAVTAIGVDEIQFQKGHRYFKLDQGYR